MYQPPSHPANPYGPDYGYGAHPQQVYGYGPQAGPGYGGYPPGFRPPVLANWGQRCAARLIDWVPLYGIVIGLMLLGTRLDHSVIVPAMKGLGPDSLRKDLLNLAKDLIMAVPGLVPFLYEWLMLGTKGRTVGKMVMKLRTADAVTGQPLPPLLARRRAWRFPLLVNLLGGLTCGVFVLIDALWPLWDKPLGQALHDKWARTIVIRTDV